MNQPQSETTIEKQRYHDSNDLFQVHRMATVNQHRQKIVVHEGLTVLKQRCRTFYWRFYTSLILMVMFALTWFLADEFIFSYYQIHQQLQYVHIPFSANLTNPDESNYFMNLIIWIFWFFAKFITAIIGSVLIIRIAKKINFFKKRIQGLVKHTVAFVLSSMLIWSGLSLVQYISDDVRDQRHRQQFFQYENHIEESTVHYAMTNSNTPKIVQHYIFAQTALLHQPSDLGIAKGYLEQLRLAEKNDPQFAQYGFSASQLWIMQKQVYGQSITPFAQSMQNKAEQAEKMQMLLQNSTAILTLISLFFMALYGLLLWRFKLRIARIEQTLSS